MASDIIQSLEYIFHVIKPRGAIVISELIRPNPGKKLFQEIIFNLLNSYRYEIEGSFRSLPGFLSIEEWSKIFSKFGFKKMEVLDNTAGYETNFVRKIAMVIHAVK